MHTWAMTTPGAHERRDLTARFACRGVRAKAHRDATANPVVPNHAALEVSVEYLKWMAHNLHRTARMRCTALDYRDKLNNDHVLHATWVHAVSAELQQYRTRTGVHVHVRCLQEGGELEWPSAVVAVRCLATYC